MEQCRILGPSQGGEGFCFCPSLSNNGSLPASGGKKSSLPLPQRQVGFTSIPLLEEMDFCLVLEAKSFLCSPSSLRLLLHERRLWGRRQGFLLVSQQQLVTSCMSMPWGGSLQSPTLPLTFLVNT